MGVTDAAAKSPLPLALSPQPAFSLTNRNDTQPSTPRRAPTAKIHLPEGGLRLQSSLSRYPPNFLQVEIMVCICFESLFIRDSQLIVTTYLLDITT